MTIGGRLRVKRAEKRLTQVRLAELVGGTQPQVSEWENDQSEPRNGQLVRLAEALGVSTDWLLTGRDMVGASPSG